MRDETYNLSELLISLSDAMDLANPILMKHQQRTAYISWCIGKSVGLNYQQKDNLFLAAILHDIGALTTKEKVSLHEMETIDPEQHCERGYHIYKQVSWLKTAANIVKYHHTPWSILRDVSDDCQKVESQILFLADVLERLIDKNIYILNQKDDLIQKITAVSGDTIHQDVVDSFIDVAKADQFWLDITSSKLEDILRGIFKKRSIYLTLDEMKNIALVFKNIIDFRSPFTAAHSTGVAACASKLAMYFNFSEKEIDLMRIAGHLHDIGKLAISNELLEKPASLTKDEFSIMKQHVYHSYQILSKIGGFGQITNWAVFHHEKMDGTGYPFALESKNLSLGAKIFAVSDVFTALCEDRPYRKAMSQDKIKKIMNRLVEAKHLDKNVVEVLLKNRDEIYNYLQSENKKAIQKYNDFFQI